MRSLLRYCVVQQCVVTTYARSETSKYRFKSHNFRITRSMKKRARKGKDRSRFALYLFQLKTVRLKRSTSLRLTDSISLDFNFWGMPSFHRWSISEFDTLDIFKHPSGWSSDDANSFFLFYRSSSLKYTLYYDLSIVFCDIYPLLSVRKH